MNIRILPIAFLLLLATACERNNVTDTNTIENTTARNTNEQYTVAVNNCSAISNIPNAIEICLDSVVINSRCPPSVVCAWGGGVVCRFKVKTASGSQMVTLGKTAIGHFAVHSYPNQANVFNMSIKLEDVIPYVDHVTYNDYKAVVKITP